MKYDRALALRGLAGEIAAKDKMVSNDGWVRNPSTLVKNFAAKNDKKGYIVKP